MGTSWKKKSDDVVKWKVKGGWCGLWEGSESTTEEKETVWSFLPLGILRQETGEEQVNVNEDYPGINQGVPAHSRHTTTESLGIEIGTGLET